MPSWIGEKLRVLNFDVIVGVPYTAIPIATAISLKHNQSMIFVRKERKDYGTKKLIEGDYHRGQKGLIIDDVITNGESKLDTTKPLKEEGLIVEDIVVLVDRGQGGLELLKKHGYNCHIIFNMKEVFEILLKYKRISREIVAECVKFMRTTKKQFLKQ